MEIEVQPEPTAEERLALVQVLEGAGAAQTGAESAWRRAALLEATETEEP